MILVTGHQGFVGGYLSRELNDYIGYDLLSGDDIRDEERLERVFKDNSIDTVIHLAAKAGVRASALIPDEFVSTNITGTRILLSLAEKHGVTHFVSFSSSSVYGSQKPPNAEDTPFRPDSIYGMTKAASEMLCHISKVPTTIIRPFTLYGKHGRKDQVVYTWLEQYKAHVPALFYGDGSSKRGYTHVKDLLDGLSLILKKGPPQSGHETYNLGGHEIITLSELADIFKDELPGLEFDKRPQPTFDVYENWADTQKAERELGWEPTRDFKTEMRSIIRDFVKEEIPT